MEGVSCTLPERQRRRGEAAAIPAGANASARGLPRVRLSMLTEAHSNRATGAERGIDGLMKGERFALNLNLSSSRSP